MTGRTPATPRAATPQEATPQEAGARVASPRAVWHRRAGAVVLAWAVALVAAVAAHPFLVQPRWTLVHLLTIGVLGNAVLIWTWHFATALLRVPTSVVRRGEVTRLAAFNVAAVTLVGGMLGDVAPLVVAAGAGLLAVVATHALALGAAVRRALPGRFAVTLRYLVAAAGLLCVGGGAGVLMGSGALERARGGLPERVLVAHTQLVVPGWLGLTVTGTLLTLWPTMLRTRIPDGVERHCRRMLPALVAAVIASAGATLTGRLGPAAAGPALVAVLLVGLAAPYRHTLPWRAGRPGSGTASARGDGPDAGPQRVAVPIAPAAVPVLAGLGWLVGALLAESVALVTAPDWARAAERVSWLTPALLVGFAAQVLTGALAYLLPVVLGGGPSAARESARGMARGWAARAVLLNVGLLGCLLPVPPAVRVALSLLVVGAVAAVPMLAVGVAVRQRGRRPRAAGAARSASEPGGVGAARSLAPRRPHAAGQAVAALAVLVLAVAAGVAVDPAATGMPQALGASGASGVAPSGRTTRVEVRVEGMRFVPDTIEVPRGDRLVLTLVNSGDDRHDLVLATGARTPRLAPGARAELDAGVIGADVEGWCSLPGHRMRGMTLTVRATGAPPIAAAAAPPQSHEGHAAHGTQASGDAVPIPDADVVRALAAPPSPSSPVTDAHLAPAGRERLHRVTLRVSEQRDEVAPGLVQTRWTFGGRAPGPVLRGRVGDTFEVTLVNDGTIGHSIDFHAGSLAPDGPMRTIQPGQTLTYRFHADQAGVWMYHCSTMPMSLHLANGMYGAVVIDPPDLAPVAREYVLVQSELYLGAPDGTADDVALREERPDLVVFNGRARQYDAHPLAARAGERVRVWVLDAGPQRASSFHVVGARFDTVWTEGAYRLRPGSGGAQVLPLAPAQGGFVEFVLPEPGHYPFVSHAIVDAERGAHGVIVATR